jgi:hypothetical protein
MEIREPIYLGDGVYASFDGYMITLTAGSNVVHLEPDVMHQLGRYAKKVYEKEIAKNETTNP